MDKERDIDKEIADIEQDLDALRDSIDKYDKAREGAETSAHIDDLLQSLKEIEQDLKDLPDVVEKLNGKDSPDN